MQDDKPASNGKPTGNGKPASNGGGIKGVTPAVTQPILNPVDLQQLLPLLPSEDEFARCLAEGKECKLGNGELPKEEIKSGDNANVIRGEVIRFFAYGGGSGKLVRGPTISLSGAWISGGLDLEHASIPYALKLTYCKFNDGVKMSGAECAALYLDGSHLAKGLSADGLTTKGNLCMCNGFSAKGEVQLRDTNVGGNLVCSGGKFCNNNPKGNALIADRAAIKGGVFMREGFSAEGAVWLLGANVSGDLICSGGKFCNPGGYALIADGVMTKGYVFMREGFSAEGAVWLLGANVGRDLDCSGGKFCNPGGYALIVEGGDINGRFLWKKDKKGRDIDGIGDVNLQDTEIGVFADEESAWQSFTVSLSGCVYNRFDSNMGAQSRLEWLAKRPCWKPFSPQPYEQVAKVLFGMGQNKDAREILLKKERLQTKHERTSWRHKIWRRLWNVFAGYGYRPRYTAAWMLFFVLVGTCLFCCADNNGRIVPHQPVVLANEEYLDTTHPPCPEFNCPPDERPTELVKRLFPDYPEFNALFYSADVFIPFFSLHQEPYWYPKSRGSDGWLFRWVIPVWYWLEIGLGWVLTSLFLLSVTGLLRPRQSSGERD